jgi:hypothetical protein
VYSCSKYKVSRAALRQEYQDWTRCLRHVVFGYLMVRIGRLIGSIRRECLNQVIVFNERHLKKCLRVHLNYYHTARTTCIGRTMTTAAFGRATGPRCCHLSTRRRPASWISTRCLNLVWAIWRQYVEGGYQPTARLDFCWVSPMLSTYNRSTIIDNHCHSMS